jgi:hypothetical protein
MVWPFEKSGQQMKDPEKGTRISILKKTDGATQKRMR